MRYTVDKWGEENVAQVITFGTIKTKAAIKDAARVLHGQPGFAIADRSWGPMFADGEAVPIQVATPDREPASRSGRPCAGSGDRSPARSRR